MITWSVTRIRPGECPSLVGISVQGRDRLPATLLQHSYTPSYLPCAFSVSNYNFMSFAQNLLNYLIFMSIESESKRSRSENSD